ncbi:ABC transporter substrate-binding protein [Caloramator mitchellensis]|nr:extracellular solute-binding protein [Caloramator mitchellensis]
MKKLLSILLVLVFLFNFTSCKKKSGENKEEGKKIKVAIMYPEEQIGSVYKDIVDEYKKLNKDVEVELVMDFSDESKINDSVTKGNYDIIAVKRSQLIELAKSGLIEDLSDFSEKNELNKKLYPINLAYGKYNSKIYGIGDLPLTVEWFYNKGIFEKYGLKEPKTLKDLTNISQKLNSKDIIPISVGAMDRWTLDLLFGSISCQTTGIQELTESYGADKDSFVNIPGIDEAFNVYEKLVKSSIKKNSIDINFMQSVDDFVKGKAAILPALSATKEIIDSKKSSGFDYGVFESPISFTNVPVSKISASGGQILVIPSKSTNKEEAEKLMNFIFSDEAQKLLVEKGYISPVISSNKGETSISKTIMSHIEMTDDNSGMLIDNLSLKMSDALGIVLSDMIEGRVKSNEAWNRVLKITFQK